MSTIFNPNTGHYISTQSPLGKKLLNQSFESQLSDYKKGAKNKYKSQLSKGSPLSDYSFRKGSSTSPYSFKESSPSPIKYLESLPKEMLFEIFDKMTEDNIRKICVGNK